MSYLIRRSGNTRSRPISNQARGELQGLSLSKEHHPGIISSISSARKRFCLPARMAIKFFSWFSINAWNVKKRAACLGRSIAYAGNIVSGRSTAEIADSRIVYDDGFIHSGLHGWTRTSGLLCPRQALYQTELRTGDLIPEYTLNFLPNHRNSKRFQKHTRVRHLPDDLFDFKMILKIPRCIHLYTRSKSRIAVDFREFPSQRSDFFFHKYRGFGPHSNVALVAFDIMLIRQGNKNLLQSIL